MNLVRIQEVNPRAKNRTQNSNMTIQGKYVISITDSLPNGEFYSKHYKPPSQHNWHASHWAQNIGQKYQCLCTKQVLLPRRDFFFCLELLYLSDFPISNIITLVDLESFLEIWVKVWGVRSNVYWGQLFSAFNTRACIIWLLCHEEEISVNVLHTTQSQTIKITTLLLFRHSSENKCFKKN